MICCLNPNCQNPHNDDDASTCQSCGVTLVNVLRNRYRPTKLIGQGGFGRTYLATDEDRLSTRCVIKQFTPQTQGTKSLNKAVQLFNQEAVRLHELGEHPQIPTLLAYFEQDEYLYLVQQYIEGPTLTQEAQERRGFSEAQIRSLLQDLLPVLKFIHQHQVVHRDITPSNIIRRQLDNRPVLIDFGVAKQLSSEGFAQPGTKIGTEGYSPIEQLRSGKVYPSSDLYSLGATCLYLLTLTRPDELYDPLNGRWLWRERLGQRGGAVSDQLAYILNRMVEDLVNQRYQTVDEILHDLTLPLDAPMPVMSSTDVTAMPPDEIQPTTLPPTPPSSPPLPSRSPSSPPSSPPAAVRPSRPPTSGSGVPSRPPSSGSRSGSRSPSRPPTSGSREPGWHCIRTLTGHSSWVIDVAISLKPPTIISAGLDDTVRLWNARTGDLIRTVKAHARGVNAVVVSRDSRFIASCSDDDTIKIWDFNTGNLVHTLSEHTRDVTDLDLSADGRILVSSSEDKTIRIWDPHQGRLVQTLTGSAGMIKAIAIDAMAQIIASGGLDNKVRLWNVKTGNMTQVLSGHLNSINAIALSADGLFLASASKDRTVRIWDLGTGRAIAVLRDHNQEVNAVAISQNGKFLISGSSDATVRVWEFPTGRLLHTLSDHATAVRTVAVTPNGSVIVSGSFDKTIKVWQYFSA